MTVNKLLKIEVVAINTHKPDKVNFSVLLLCMHHNNALLMTLLERREWLALYIAIIYIALIKFQATKGGGITVYCSILSSII